jgi:hypothetical protein
LHARNEARDLTLMTRGSENTEANMKFRVIGLALAAIIATAGFAYADSVTVQSGSSGVVVKEKTHPDVVVHERATVGAGVDCSKKTVTHKNELTGTKVKKTTKNCD